MEKGVCKTWTSAQEEEFNSGLARVHTFAERHLIMSIRNLLKYDQRTKEGKRAIAQARLRIATATDDELEELSNLEQAIAKPQGLKEALATRGNLKEVRLRILRQGINRSELACL